MALPPSSSLDGNENARVEVSVRVFLPLLCLFKYHDPIPVSSRLKHMTKLYARSAYLLGKDCALDPLVSFHEIGRTRTPVYHSFPSIILIKYFKISIPQKIVGLPEDLPFGLNNAA